MTLHSSGQGDGYENDLLDLRSTFLALWSLRTTIIGVTLTVAIATMVYSLTLPNVYKSSALLAPTESASNGMGALAQQYGGLASLAGISLSTGGEVSKSLIAIEVMRSRTFLTDFIAKYEILPALLAADYWDKDERRLVLDADIFDEVSGEWGSDYLSRGKRTPSEQLGYEAFSGIFSVEQDVQTSLVEVSIEFISPDLAETWVSLLVREVNEAIRTQDINKSDESIKYLEEKISENQIADLDTVFYELIQTQIQSKMLAQLEREYVFMTIDPAISPDIKSGPRRAVITIVATLVGFILAIFVGLVLHYLRGGSLQREEK